MFKNIFLLFLGIFFLKFARKISFKNAYQTYVYILNYMKYPFE